MVALLLQSVCPAGNELLCCTGPAGSCRVQSSDSDPDSDDDDDDDDDRDEEGDNAIKEGYCHWPAAPTATPTIDGAWQPVPFAPLELPFALACCRASSKQQHVRLGLTATASSGYLYTHITALGSFAFMMALVNPQPG